MDIEIKVIRMLKTLVQRQDQLLEMIQDFRKEITSTHDTPINSFGSINQTLNRMISRQIDLNEQIVLLNQSVLELEERVKNLNHEERIRALENFMRKAS